MFYGFLEFWRCCSSKFYGFLDIYNNFILMYLINYGKKKVTNKINCCGVASQRRKNKIDKGNYNSLK